MNQFSLFIFLFSLVTTHCDIGVYGMFLSGGIDELAGQLVHGGRDDAQQCLRVGEVVGKGRFQDLDLLLQHGQASHLELGSNQNQDGLDSRGHGQGLTKLRPFVPSFVRSLILPVLFSSLLFLLTLFSLF